VLKFRVSRSPEPSRHLFQINNVLHLQEISGLYNKKYAATVPCHKLSGKSTEFRGILGSAVENCYKQLLNTSIIFSQLLRVAEAEIAQSV
jgi:hypothetical protein